MQRFENQVAIVTGGGRGIGAATARRLASEGEAVAVADYLKKIPLNRFGEPEEVASAVA